MEAITFEALLTGIRTVADGGVTVTLSLPQSEIESVKKLFGALQKNVKCAIVPDKDF